MPIDFQQIEQLTQLEFYTKQVVEGFISGLHRSPFHGFSAEFAEHRLYNTGESIKNIDWKLYARTEKLFIKRFEEETNLRCQILLDFSGSMHFPKGEQQNKFHYSVYAAAVIMNILKKQRDASGLTVFSEDIDTYLPSKLNDAHIKNCFLTLEGYLEKEYTPKKSNVSETLHLIAEMIPKRSLVVIFSDMFDNLHREDDVFSALQHLRFKNHEVIVFHTLDIKKELEFEFSSRPYEFVDMETQEKIKVNTAEIASVYKQKSAERQKKLKLKCGQYGIDYVQCDIQKPLSQIIMTYLAFRKKNKV
ncbi:MAG TPA: DUF58 domain-containing protein [Flavobacteriales bacterium]|nr:DUF58 domain-containing protein [Flavobacteriales bacterium]